MQISLVINMCVSSYGLQAPNTSRYTQTKRSDPRSGLFADRNVAIDRGSFLSIFVAWPRNGPNLFWAGVIFYDDFFKQFLSILCICSILCPGVLFGSPGGACLGSIQVTDMHVHCPKFPFGVVHLRYRPAKPSFWDQKGKSSLSPTCAYTLPRYLRLRGRAPEHTAIHANTGETITSTQLIRHRSVRTRPHHRTTAETIKMYVNAQDHYIRGGFSLTSQAHARHTSYQHACTLTRSMSVAFIEARTPSMSLRRT